MPIIWRYLISQYLKVFFLSVFSFIAVLLTLRVEEIAHFASIDTSKEYVFWFVLYQIPYILPIAIPLSCLIASMSLVKNLSESHEILAFRALGLSLKSLFSPLLFSALLLSFLNFYIVSEAATVSHFKTNLLKSDLKSVNPLLLLHSKHLLKNKGLFYDSYGQTKMGEQANDSVIAFPGKGDERMNLVIAKNLEADSERFKSKNITLITPFKDNLMIENTSETLSSLEDFSTLMQKKVWSINDDYLGFKFLILKSRELKEKLKNASSLEIKSVKKSLHRLYSEMFRRGNLGLAPFLFTLLGYSFGITIGRSERKKGLICVVIFASFYLTTFFLAKGFSHHLSYTLLLYLLPPLAMILGSFYNLSRISQGKSS